MDFFTYYKMAIFFVFQLVIIALCFSILTPGSSSLNPKSLSRFTDSNNFEVKDFDSELADVLGKNLSPEECTLLYIHLILKNSQLFLPGNLTAVAGGELEISDKGLKNFVRRRRLGKDECMLKLKRWSETIRERGGLRTLAQLKPVLLSALGKIGRDDVLDKAIFTILKLKHDEYEDALEEIKNHEKHKLVDKDNDDGESREDFTLPKIIGILTFTIILMLCCLKCILSANNYKSEFIERNTAAYQSLGV